MNDVSIVRKCNLNIPGSDSTNATYNVSNGVNGYYIKEHCIVFYLWKEGLRPGAGHVADLAGDDAPSRVAGRPHLLCRRKMNNCVNFFTLSDDERCFMLQRMHFLDLQDKLIGKVFTSKFQTLGFGKKSCLLCQDDSHLYNDEDGGTLLAAAVCGHDREDVRVARGVVQRLRVA